MARIITTGCLAMAVAAACSDGRTAGSEYEAEGERGGTETRTVVDAGAPPPADLTTLELAARQRPDSIRDEIASALRRSAAADPAGATDSSLARARSLAEAYAGAWADSFLVRRVARFEGSTPGERTGMAAADSLLRTARVVYGQEGVAAAMALWRESLRRAMAAGDSAGRAAALVSLGAGHYLAGEWDGATAYLEEGRRLAEAVGDHRTRGNALGNLGSIQKDRGDLARAAELYRQASEIRPLSGDSRGLAMDQNNLGLIAWSLGDLEDARQAFERALTLNRQEGRDRGVAINLTNLGDLASVDGDYGAAQAFYEEALEINRASGDEAQTGFVLHDLGLLTARRGDYPRAIELLSQALAVHERSGAALEAIAARSDLASVQAATGDLDGALMSLERARQEEAGAAVPSVQGDLALARADLLVQLGAYDEAGGEYQLAEEAYRKGQDGGGLAAAHSGHALIGYLWDDHTGALHHLDLAARAHEAQQDRRSAALTQVLEGVVRQEMGDTSAARRTLSSAHRTLVELGDAAGSAAALSALGNLALEGGSALAAETHYRRGLEDLGERPAADVRWRLHAGLGRALRSQGALGAASEQLRASIAAIEEVAGGLQHEHRRAGFLSDKWDAYGTLALLERERGRAADVFAISERVRSRQTLAMLGRGRVDTRDAGSGREQDLRRRMAELMQEIEQADPETGRLRDPSLAERPIDVAREALAATQSEYTRLLLEVRSSNPEYAHLVSPEPIDWRDVARRLSPDMALLQYLVADSGSVVVVVTRDTIAALDLDIRRQELANLIDFTRGVLEPPGGPRSPTLWRAPLRRLHHHLIEPVEREGLLWGRRTLVIVPHAELHFLPFGALLGPPTGGAPDAPDRFLIERFEIVHAPSARAWSRLTGREPRPPATRVLALAPRTDALPASGEEVSTIRSIYGRRTAVLTDSLASKAALRAALPRADVLHLATFGVLNKHNPLFSYVELAPTAEDDGRLEVHEVFDLGLEGQFIVLSACQTGLASGALTDIPEGDDWVGLVEGFLQAGAGGVLASLWRVDDRATAELMQRFYRHLRAGGAEAAALASAQRELLRDPRTSHPFYWAGFVLSGPGRR